MCGARRTESGLGVTVFFFVLTNADAMSARPPTWTTVTTQWPLVGAMIATAPDPRDDMTRGASPTAYYDVKVTMKAWAPAVFASILLLAAPSGGQAGPPVNVTAQGVKFLEATLTAPAAGFTFHFDNKDAGTPHDIDILDASGKKVFDSKEFPGPAVHDVPVPPIAASRSAEPVITLT